jgi:hypothetical protein
LGFYKREPEKVLGTKDNNPEYKREPSEYTKDNHHKRKPVFPGKYERERELLYEQLFYFAGRRLVVERMGL